MEIWTKWSTLVGFMCAVRSVGMDKMCDCEGLLPTFACTDAGVNPIPVVLPPPMFHLFFHVRRFSECSTFFSMFHLFSRFNRFLFDVLAMVRMVPPSNGSVTPPTLPLARSSRYPGVSQGIRGTMWYHVLPSGTQRYPSIPVGDPQSPNNPVMPTVFLL